jgi:hypothetical protein
VDFRETLNEKPAISWSLAGAFVVLLVVVAWREFSSSGRAASTHAGFGIYFSDDDGQTYFADDAAKLTPFDHNGREAVRCNVFKNSSGPFVGYLEKVAPPSFSTNNGAPSIGDPTATDLVKRPGDKGWVPICSAAGKKIVDVHSPDGSSQSPEQVLP